MFVKNQITLMLCLLAGVATNAQSIEVLSFGELETMINSGNEKIQVYNFWATYCRPCIKEMPYFEALTSKNQDVDVIFVSLDFKENLNSKVIPFLKKKEIRSDVVLLDDIDYNSWIDKISPEWSGAIPATLFVDQDGKRHFHEGEMSEEQLKSFISVLSNKSQ